MTTYTIEMRDRNGHWAQNFGDIDEPFQTVEQAASEIRMLQNLRDDDWHRDGRVIEYDSRNQVLLVPYSGDTPTISDALRRLDEANLSHLAGELWCVEGAEGCDTANMLVAIGEQTGEDPVSLADAISLLKTGNAPRGATPYPSCAEALLEIRREQNPGEEM